MRRVKEVDRRSAVTFLVALLSVIGLCCLSYVTVLDYSFENRNQFITSCNQGLLDEMETSLRFGKSLESYYGIQGILQKGADLLGGDCVLVLSGADGTALASSTEESRLRFDLSAWNEVVQEINGPDGSTAGTLNTWYPRSGVVASLRPVLYRTLGLCLGLWAVMVAVSLAMGVLRHSTSRQLVLVALVFFLLQGAALVALYEPRFEAAARSSAKSVATAVSASVQDLTDKGVKLEEIADLEDYLEQKQQENPGIQDIFLVKAEEARSGDNRIVRTIVTEQGDMDLCFVFEVNEASIRRSVLDMALTFAATIALMAIVMRESLVLSELAENRGSVHFDDRSQESYAALAKSIRLGNFLSVTFDYICLSFSALQIRAWNQGLLGSSPAFAAALALSICGVADILGMLAMPSLGRHVRPRQLMTASAVILLLSNGACFLTHSTLVIVLMRFFAGLGNAGVKQVRNTVISQGYTNEVQRNANLTASNNGVIGGLLCGMGLGSVVAGVFGYGATFLAAAIGNVIYFLFETQFLPWRMLSDGAQEGHSAADFPVRLGRVLRNTSVWRTILLFVVPQYFMLMVIVCLLPAHIQSARMPGVVLTYANLFNGLAGLYLGEKLFRFLQRRLRLTRIMYLLMAVGVASIVMLKVPVAAVPLVLLSAALLGFVDGIGTPVATDLFIGNAAVMLNLDDTESLMVYTLLGNAVMSASPFLLEGVRIGLGL